MKRSPAAGLLLFSLAAAFSASAAEPEEHMLSGTRYVQEKNYKEAVREYQTAVRMDPKNPDANLLLGLTLANTGDFEEAVKYTEAALELKPGYTGYYNLGLIHANQGNYTDAAGAYEKALELNPSSYQAWHQLGKVYFTDLRFEKAAEAYKKVIELNPKFAEAYQGLGSSYYWLDNKAGALEQAAKLRELKLNSRADELDGWIKDKESKKKKAADKAAPSQ